MTAVLGKYWARRRSAAVWMGFERFCGA
jgi:hypothetical protein